MNKLIRIVMLFDLIHHIYQVSSHFGQLAGLLQADFLRSYIQDKVALTEHSLSRLVVLKVGYLPGTQNGILITPDFQVSHVRFKPNLYKFTLSSNKKNSKIPKQNL